MTRRPRPKEVKKTVLKIVYQTNRVSKYIESFSPLAKQGPKIEGDRVVLHRVGIFDSLFPKQG